MKMVKSLLLGSAAGLVAVTAGQAADLPVKAKPVEYVKVCSLYGAGFYYMPGTDMCIKIGGWVRVEATEGNDNGSMTWGPFAGPNNTRDTANFVTRARGYITADAREQTAYGTARAYIDVGLSDSSTTEYATSGNGFVGTGTFSSNRAFLQWAGFTAGITQSFYDFYSAPAVAYRAAFMPIEDTGDGGTWVWGYTAQFGNGLSGTVSAEIRRTTQIIGAVGGAAVTGVFSGSSVFGGTSNAVSTTGAFPGYGGNQAPDVVLNLRLDQTWGGAQIMGALHDVNAQYYDVTAANGAGAGHPSDTVGWVIGAGLRLNFPTIAPGDYFQGEFNYTQGALRYLNQPTQGNFVNQQSNTGAYGILSDCVYGATAVTVATATNGTSCNLTTAWSVNASYEHYWTPSVHESFVGAYEAVNYNSQANAILCTVEGTSGGGATAAANGTATATGWTANGGCNNNWSVWGVSSRLQWDVTKTFYLGVEVMYNHLNSAQSVNGYVPGNIGSIGAAPAAAISTLTIGGAAENAWSATVRMHKDFLP